MYFIRELITEVMKDMKENREETEEVASLRTEGDRIILRMAGEVKFRCGFEKKKPIDLQ